MNSLKSFLKRVVKNVTRQIAYIRLKRLQVSKSPQVEKITRAVSEAIKNDLNASERDKLREIEAIRKELSNSAVNIEVSDFGAGKAGSTRTEEEMLSGVTRSTTIAAASKASKSPFWSLVLFKLLRGLEPVTCVELGSCVGISAAYQAAALEFNRKGTLTTMEGAESLAAITEKTLKALNFHNADVVTGRFQDNLEEVLIRNAPVDYVFIDGHHDELATLNYFEMCMPYLSSSAIIVFDDISWSDGMKRAWNKIATSKSVKLAFDFRAIGICVLDTELEDNNHFRFPMR